jgi:hypothetical protein
VEPGVEEVVVAVVGGDRRHGGGEGGEGHWGAGRRASRLKYWATRDRMGFGRDGVTDRGGSVTERYVAGHVARLQPWPGPSIALAICT